MSSSASAPPPPEMATKSGLTGPLVSNQPSRTDRTGTPRRSSSRTAIPVDQLAERWLIAHEYGHAFAAGIPWQRTPHPQWKEELFADLNATVWTVLSADRLDRLPPELTLASAVFALACSDVLRRALSVVRDGHPDKDAGTESHPPHEVRARAVVDGFRRLFDVTYDDAAGTWELTPRFDLCDPPKTVNAAVDQHLTHAFEFANGLFAIWKRVGNRLVPGP